MKLCDQLNEERTQLQNVSSELFIISNYNSHEKSSLIYPENEKVAT